MFVGQDERPKPTQQFTMRFGAAMDKVSASRNSKNVSNKVEKEKAYEGQRLPMSPIGMSLWVRKKATELDRHRDRSSHFVSFVGGCSNTNITIIISNNFIQLTEYK